ncbi:MAG: hypothetical protein QOF88_3437 [Mycobacterium sp.]|nr:hypothetical protein [Mycobacterium sp.]
MPPLSSRGQDPCRSLGPDHLTKRRNRYGKGFESVAWATDSLVALVGPLIDVWESRGIPGRVETIVLRDRADKTEVDYPETADTIVMREQVRIVNENLAQLELLRRGQKLDIPIGRRIINDSFDRGGRFYCHGPSFQNIPARQRLEIEWIIDGGAHPAVEIDYANLHIRMAYSEAGEPIPDGDQYTIDGFDRGLVKVAVNTLFNAPTTNSAILAIANDLRYNPDLRAVNNMESADPGPCRALAKRVVVAIHQKHRRIKSYFGSDCGALFQRQDSDMAMEVMTRMIQRTGRCPLPVHDSFLVPEIDADILSQTMIEVAREYGLELELKDSRGNHSTTPLFQLGVTTSDLRGSDRQIRWYRVSYIARRESVDTPGTARASAPIPPSRGPPDSAVVSGLRTISSVITTRWDATRFGGALPRHSHRSEQESKATDNTIKCQIRTPRRYPGSPEDRTLRAVGWDYASHRPAERSNVNQYSHPCNAQSKPKAVSRQRTRPKFSSEPVARRWNQRPLTAFGPRTETASSSTRMS